ncbi:hypothetical protein [Deinococcus multiflagellatus]|uniref:hypothetical protein n=1 Tax=Deinococcus multiflagellatus TaxID=1656887 RepID=UPI001CCD2AF8|nr:hypothetical protein [Deinococcus multiflagellatus]MBZ9714333.1 hypothetical protein [Deinococcus multiflagellatus]
MSNPARRHTVQAAMKAMLLSLCTLLTLAGAQGLPPVPYQNTPAVTTVGGLKVCQVGETRYLLDRAGRVRSLDYARLIPDNTLRVRQSYDRAGRLTGMQVQWTGFAGPLLNVRGAFDARGRLVKETGFRRAGVTTPLRSYLRPVPRGLKC